MKALENTETIILPSTCVTESGQLSNATIDINHYFIDFISEDSIYFRINAAQLSAICAIVDYKIAEHEASKNG